jgi:hypothetical protein
MKRVALLVVLLATASVHAQSLWDFSQQPQPQPQPQKKHVHPAYEDPVLQALIVVARATGVKQTITRPDGFEILAMPTGELRWNPPAQRAPVQQEQVVYRQPAPRPEVAYPQGGTFRGGNYDPDHQCDRCGTTQVVIAGWNGDGTHNHECPRCGNRWRH